MQRSYNRTGTEQRPAIWLAPPHHHPRREVPLAKAGHQWHKGVKRMKKLICLGLVCLVWNYSALAQDKAATPAVMVFQIGVADGDYHEFALAGNYQAYPQTFPHDADFVVGQSDPKKDWPWIHPGPTDGWAGGGAHTFKITFTLPEVAVGYYRLVLDFVDTHAAEPPGLTVGINGTPLKLKLPPGHGDESLSNAKVGKNYSLQQVLPATLLHA